MTTVGFTCLRGGNYCNFPRPGRWPRSMGQIFYFLANHSSRNYSFNLSSRAGKKTQFCPHERHSLSPSPMPPPFSYSSFTKNFSSPRNTLHQRFSRARLPVKSAIIHPIGKLLPSVEPITNRYYRFLENAPYLKISSPPPFPVHHDGACPFLVANYRTYSPPGDFHRVAGNGRREKNRGNPLPSSSSSSGNEQQRSVKEGGEMVNWNHGEEKKKRRLLPVRPKIVSIPSEVTPVPGQWEKSKWGDIIFSVKYLGIIPNVRTKISSVPLHRVFDLAAFLGPSSFHHQPRFRWDGRERDEREREYVNEREIRDEKWTRRSGARRESGKKREEGKGRARKGEWVCTLARLNTTLLTG